MKTVKASVTKCPFRAYGMFCRITNSNKNCPSYVPVRGERIPYWCPLKKGPVTVELEQAKE